MDKKIFLFCGLVSTLFGADYKYDCRVPDKIMQTIRLTENESANPYIIRTNDSLTLNKFHSISNKHQAKINKNDKQVIHCQNVENCSALTRDLVLSGITNLDLGLYQINFPSYPKQPEAYFIEQYAYRIACNAVIDKVRIAKKWNWGVLANYNSATPKFNKIYKEKLIKNYERLSKN